MASLNINENLRAFAAAQAAKRGMRSAAEYVEQLLQQTQDLEQDKVAPTGARNAAQIAGTLAELDRLRKGNRLNGQSIRELVEEGRRS